MTHDSSTILGFVVDTDVLSYLLRGDSRAERFRPMLERDTPHAVLSFMTIAELDRLTLGRNWGETRRMELDAYLNKRFLIYDKMSRDLCRKWAEIKNQCQRKGIALGDADAWIAATAITLGLPLLTNNTKHYVWIDDLRLITPGEENP
jgi:predicted nucleic acid-binding protein